MLLFVQDIIRAIHHVQEIKKLFLQFIFNIIQILLKPENGTVPDIPIKAKNCAKVLVALWKINLYPFYINPSQMLAGGFVCPAAQTPLLIKTSTQINCLLILLRFAILSMLGFAGEGRPDTF